MTVRYEGINASDLSTTVVPAGSVLGEIVVDRDHLAIVLDYAYDEVVYITGTKDVLRRHLSRMLRQLEATEPNDPVPPDFLPDDEEIA